AVQRADANGQFTLLDTVNAKPIDPEGVQPLGFPFFVTFGKEGKTLIALNDKDIKHWRIADGKVLSTARAPARVSSISADGRTIITHDENFNLHVWDGPAPNDGK